MDEIEDPRSGQRWVFRRTGGELLEADLYVSRGGYVRSHLHPRQEETFTGVSGTFALEVAGEPRLVRPGESLVIPAGTPHGFRDAGEDAHVRVAVRPALRLDDYFRVFLGLSRDGRIRMPARGLPRGILELALVMDAYADEVAAPRLPLVLQRRLWAALAALARRRGHDGQFREYRAPTGGGGASA